MGGGAISVNKKRKICADYILSQVWSSLRATQWSVDFRGIILCLWKRKRRKGWLRKVKVVGNQLFVESTSICHQDDNYNTETMQICNKITGRWLDRSQPLFYFVPHVLSHASWLDLRWPKMMPKTGRSVDQFRRKTALVLIKRWKYQKKQWWCCRYDR